MFIMAEKYIMVDLNDPRSSKIAEAMSNKTCKKILEIISENEMSETEIAAKLSLPLNTVDYNIKNLVEAGLIEPVKNVLWSVKGRRVLKYKVSNKKIVISPKTMFKGVVPAILGVAVVSYIVKMITTNNFISTQSKSVELTNAVSSSASEMVAGATQIAGDSLVKAAPYVYYTNSGFMSAPIWAWFALGGLVALLIYIILKILDERRWK
jgi:predicted transcriptional regulator